MDNRLNLVVQFGQKGLDKLQGGLKNLVGLGKTGSKALRDMARETRSLERELAGVRRELDGAAGNVSELVNRERELERAVASANEQMRRQRALTEIDNRAAAMRARGSELISKGQSNVTQGAAMLAPLILAGKLGAEFSSGMVDIQQKAGLTNAATDRLAGNISRIAEGAAQFPEDVRSGLDLLLARGLNVDAATAAMGPATKLATAYKVEIPDAAGAAYASLKNLKVASKDVGLVFDSMAAAGNAGGFEIRDMARHFPSLTAQMAALGERGVPAVADLSAALQVAMHTAGNADEAGNNITNLLAKINAPGTIKKFEQNFGIDLPRAMKKLTDEGYSTLEAIALITDRATGGDDKKLGFAFEDRQAQMGILALIQNLEEFRDIRAQAMDSQGTVDGAFDQRMSRDQMVQLRQLGVAFANLVLSAAPVLLPFLRKVTTMMTAGVTAITGWARAHPQAASMLLKLFAAVAIGKVALGGLQIAFGGLLGPMSAAYRYFAKVDGISRFGAHLARFKGIAGTTATVGVKAFGLLRSGAMFLARGLVRAGMMMLANPMVLLIAGIVVAVGLLAYAVYSNWDKIRAGFSAGWAYVTDLLSGAANWMGSIGRQMMNGLLSAIDPMALGGRLVNMARNGITQFKNYLGIKSPSRVFMEMGGHVAGGLALGIDRRGPTAMASARRLAAGVAGAAALGTGAPLAAGGGGSMGGVGGAPVYQITVNVPAGAEADSIAAAVRREVEAIERRRAAVDRSRFGDG